MVSKNTLTQAIDYVKLELERAVNKINTERTWLDSRYDIRITNLARDIDTLSTELSKLEKRIEKLEDK